MVQMFNFFVNRNEELTNIQDYVKFLYLIPATYVIIVLGAAIRSFLLTGLGTLLNVLVIGITMKYIFTLPTPVLNSITIGVYLVLISVVGLIYNICTLNFEQTN